MIDWYLGDDRHHNGALTLAQTFNFLSSFDQPRTGLVNSYPARPTFATSDGYNFFLRAGSTKTLSPRQLSGKVAFWDSIMAHPNYDAYWQKRSIWKHVKNIKPAVLTVGGWYDGEDPYGPLRLNQSLEEMSASTKRTFVMGPWTHGAWNRGDDDSLGVLKFGSKTGTFFRDSIGFPFFSCAVEGSLQQELAQGRGVRDGREPVADVRCVAAEGRKADADLPAGGGSLAYAKPVASNASDSYVSDPAKPVPYTSQLSFGYYQLYPHRGSTIREPATRRARVSNAESLDHDLTLAGPIGVTLQVATTGTDADFIVKVIDVYPDVPLAGRGGSGPMDGFEQLVKGDVYRARWRRSLEKPIPLMPGKPDSVTYVLHDVFHTFKKGHRLMVHVQSTWFPLIDRNPQKFVPNINTADASDFP